MVARLHGTHVAVVLFAVVLLAPGLARAGHDVRRTFEFLGFSGDGTKYILKVTDDDFGDSVSVRNFTTGKQEKAFPIEDKKDEKKVVETARKQFKVKDRGSDSQQSPDGKLTILGIPREGAFQLNLMRGNTQAKFKTIPVETAKVPTKVTLKSVFWSEDGRKIVVLIHKKRVDENGVDADEAHPFEFLTGGLNFR